MTDEHRQRLSALRDGELGEPELPSLFAALDRDPELGAVWERYHLIGQAIRGERIDPACRAIAAGVRRALDADPDAGRDAELDAGFDAGREAAAGNETGDPDSAAPSLRFGTVPHRLPGLGAGSGPGPRAASRPRRPRARWRRAALTGGLLAAAATLTLAILVPQVLERDTSFSSGRQPPLASRDDAGPPIALARRWHLDQPELVSKLDLLLVRHQEQLPGAGASGMLNYVTLVGYEAPR